MSRDHYLKILRISKIRKEEISKIYKIDRESMLIFYKSEEWKLMKSWVYQRYEKECAKCGSKTNLSVDHIRPISCHPRLALKHRNLRILCMPCNKNKSFIMASKKDMDIKRLKIINGSIEKFKFKNESELINKFFPKR